MFTCGPKPSLLLIVVYAGFIAVGVLVIIGYKGKQVEIKKGL